VFKGVSAVAGHEVKPYEPESFVGKLLQAGVTGAGAGLIDPAALFGAVKGGATGAQALAGALEGAGTRAAKMAIASDAANATQQAFPNDPGLAALAAVAAHGAAGTAAPIAKAGYRSSIAPLVSPTARGRIAAGNALADVDHAQPGLANPTTAEIDTAKNNVKTATGNIGVGQDDYDAGGALRDQLQTRKDALTTARSTAAKDAYGVFREQPPMPGQELAPFMQSPAFRAAIKAASAGRLNRGLDPLTTLFHFDEANAGEPTLIPNAAVPPDVLQRIKGKLDDAIGGAKGTDKADLVDLKDRFVSAIDARYPQTYPPTREEFATNSRPLDPLETGPTAKVLDSENRFGTRVYSMAQDKVVRSYLQQNSASVSSVKNLVDSFGGDKNAALGALQDNLVSKVQDAINSDGTLSQQAFERAVRPYTKALNMHFPELARKFSTAQGAQKAYELVQEQKSLADDIGANRALRGGDNFVTRDSAMKWLDQNEASLEKTQSKAAVMRLRKIAEALPDDPASGAQAAVEAAPMLVGGAAGGLEGGVLGGITHKIPAAIAAPLLKRYYESYSQAVEKAFTDPATAADLASKAQKFGGFKKVLTKAARDAVLATPTAVNAGRTASPQ
jgi:hypothetical protein